MPSFAENDRFIELELGRYQSFSYDLRVSIVEVTGTAGALTPRFIGSYVGQATPDPVLAGLQDDLHILNPLTNDSLLSPGPRTATFLVEGLINRLPYTQRITFDIVDDEGVPAYVRTETHRDDYVSAQDANGLILSLAGNDTVIMYCDNYRVDGGPGFDRLEVPFNLTPGTIQATATGHIFTSGSPVDHTAGVEFTNVERVKVDDTIYAFDFSGNAGQAYRLYQAAFDRTPDIDGLGYWIHEMDTEVRMPGVGSDLVDVAQGFIASAEFRSVYGANPTAEQVVGRFYENVLGRSGEPAGVAYWVGEMQRGVPLHQVLIGFSESAENVALVAPVIRNGIVLDGSDPSMWY